MVSKILIFKLVKASIKYSPEDRWKFAFYSCYSRLLVNNPMLNVMQI